jgi:DNA primase
MGAPSSHKRAFAEAMAQVIAAEDPDHNLAMISKQKRKGKVG